MNSHDVVLQLRHGLSIVTAPGAPPETPFVIVVVLLLFAAVLLFVHVVASSYHITFFLSFDALQLRWDHLPIAQRVLHLMN